MSTEDGVGFPIPLVVTAPMRMYVMVPQEGATNGAVAECTFFINYFPAIALFDCSASHSFIESELICKKCLRPSVLVHPLSTFTLF